LVCDQQLRLALFLTDVSNDFVCFTLLIHGTCYTLIIYIHVAIVILAAAIIFIHLYELLYKWFYNDVILVKPITGTFLITL